MLKQAALDQDLRRFARGPGAISVVVALAAGVLMHPALHSLLVRPMRRIIGNVANPRLAGGEIAVASRGLAALQQELRAALWRNARRAVLAAAVGRASHDLRGILSPALLTAERLQMHADPQVSHAGDVLVRTVERATALARRR